MADERDQSTVIADLNDLLQLDHDAVQAYTVAIDMVRDDAYRHRLVDFRADHKRHIEELAALVRDRGGLPTEIQHPTGVLKLAVQSVGSVLGDDALLLAFKAVEGQARDKYRRLRDLSWPQDAAEVVQRGAEDEEKHYHWVEETLRARGVGEGTLPHRLASVVEAVHKAIADPAEALERQVMQSVGDVVGTTRTRGGSEAPSPAEAVERATEMAADAATPEEGRDRRDSDGGRGGSGLVDPSGRPL